MFVRKYFIGKLFFILIYINNLVALPECKNSFFKDEKINTEIYFEKNIAIEKLIYYKTGELKSRVNLDLDCKNNGIEKVYNKDKTLAIEIEYNHSNTPVQRTIYYKTGELKSTVTFDMNGRNNGIEKVYNKDKTLNMEIEYRHSSIPYKIYKFYKTGELKVESSYLYADTATTKTYFISGELKSLTPYIKGKVTGIEYIYYKNGKIKYEIYLKNNKIINGFIYETPRYDRRIMNYTDLIKMSIELKY